jgi:excisionase family DNA binding protein
MTEVATAREGLNIREAADLVGVHYQTMRNWIAAGKVAYTQFGSAEPGKKRIIRIHEDDLAPLRATAHRTSST